MRQVKMLFSVIAAMMLMSVQSLMAQNNVKITGQVTDAEGQPLEGVAVMDSEKKTGTLTDAQGKYTFSVKEKSVLIFDYMGYTPVEIRLGGGRTVVNVSLEEDRTFLEEAVVVGYGTVRRSDLTGSVSSVSAKSLENFKTANVLDALGGQVAGVNITTTDGAPGSSFNIIVRGVSTINGESSPLYVVDGFEVEDISHISNNDIQFIEVLKDASAAAIYGARGANGVVLITTKSGSNARPVVSYNGAATYRSLANKLEVLKPYDFVKLQVDRDSKNSISYYMTGSDNNGNPYRYQTLDDYRGLDGIDWQDVAFHNTWSQSHDVSLTGGNAKSQYAVSFSHYDEDGIFKNSGFAKNSARIKFNQVITERLKFNVNISYSNQHKYGLGTGGYVLRNIIAYRPTGGLSVSDWELLNRAEDPGLDNSYNTSFNPLLATTTADINNVRNTWTANGALTWDIIKGLSFKTSGNFNQWTVRDSYFYHEGSQQSARSGGPYGGSSLSQSTIWAVNNVLTYQNKFGKHRVSAMLGQEFQRNMSESVSAQAKEFTLGDLGVDKLSAGNVPSLAETSRTEKSRLSFFTRLFYNYADRYMVTATFRADGSSVFAKHNRWGFFPSFAAAWTLSNESWLKSEKWLTNLKLRAGYGTVGNDRIGSNTTLEIYAIQKVGIGSSQTAALVPAQLSNPDLRWEGSTTVNVGVDFSVLKNRIGLTVDAFIKDTKDLLMKRDLSFISGWASQWQNVGKIRNKGLEISLKTINVNKRNFSWSTNFNISFIDNKLVSLLDGTDHMFAHTNFDSSYTNNDYIAKVGESLGAMYGYIYDGNYQYSDFYDTVSGTRKLVEGVVDCTEHIGTAVEPGMVKYKDLPTIDTDGDGIPDKGDGKITAADRTIIGNGYADFFGGITNTFHAYGFDFSFMFQYSYGNDVYNVTRLFGTRTSSTGTNMLTEVLDRWTPYHASNTVPAVEKKLNLDIYSRYIEDGSYLRLKNVTLGYTFPSKWMRKAKISKLRLYATATNLFCLTKYSGYDPEVNWKNSALMPGVDYGSYPKNRALTMGLEISF